MIIQKTLGTTATFTLDGANATADGDFEVVFSSSTAFDVYNNSTGVVTASGTTGTEFSVNGMGITIAADGTNDDGYKYNFSLTNGNNTLTSVEEGNRGLSANTSLAGTSWGE